MLSTIIVLLTMNRGLLESVWNRGLLESVWNCSNLPWGM